MLVDKTRMDSAFTSRRRRSLDALGLTDIDKGAERGSSLPISTAAIQGQSPKPVRRKSVEVNLTRVDTGQPEGGSR